MKKFRYRGYDSQSVEQVGTLEAENYSEAYAALNYQGVTVVKLEATAGSFSQVAENFYLKLKIGGQWRAVFFRELSVMLSVMTLHDSLKTLAGAAKNHPAEKILLELVAAVGEGQTFSQALERYEIIFGGDAIQSVEIGEASGNLQDVTARLAAQLERNYSTEKKVRGAMYYPLFVLMAAFVAAIILVNVTARNADTPARRKIFGGELDYNRLWADNRSCGNHHNDSAHGGGKIFSGRTQAKIQTPARSRIQKFFWAIEFSA